MPEYTWNGSKIRQRILMSTDSSYLILDVCMEELKDCYEMTWKKFMVW